MSDQADFFVAGGTLHPLAPSYVTRPADQELYERILEGQFCYALTSRQMGKSSLMVRTTRRLKQAGIATAMIDLTGIGVTHIDPWYIGLLTKIKADLRLAVDVESWWTARQTLSAPQCLIEFLHDVVLAERSGPIAIFVDEIDSTLALPFRDDFFAAIRAMYNARANDPIYNRLTFALLGVATPTDLIQDRARTPFNIGRRIVLQELSEADAEPLQRGLEAIYPGQSHTLLARIFYWTNGHPYLTQKLCLAVVQAGRAEWSNQDIDELVEANFLIKEARKESNLQFIQDRIRSTPPDERRRMLNLYYRIYTTKTVPDDDRSPPQNHLELAGLVGVDAGKLRIRNRIYQRVFDLQWIRDNTPANTQLRTAIVAAIATLLLIAISIYIVRNPPTSVAAQAELCRQNFETTSSPAVRLQALACLFDREYDEQALRLFYERLDTDEQKFLFLNAGPQVDIVVRGIYVTLDSQMPSSSDMMDWMVAALNRSQQPEAEALKHEIETWKQGRKLAAAGRYQEAIEIYTQTIQSNSNNSAARYDRALAYIASRQYQAALADLNAIIQLSTTALPTSTAVSSTISTNPTLNFTATATIDAATISTSTTGPPATASSPTSSITPTAGSAISRFIQAEQIAEMVGDLIRSDAELRSYLEVNLGSYQQLSKMAKRWGLQVSRADPTATSAPPAVPTQLTPPTSAPPTPTPEPPTPTAPPAPTFCRVDRAVFIRTGPSNTAPLITGKDLDAGSQVVRLGESADGFWIRVRDPLDGSEGWVFENFLEPACRSQ